MVFTRTCSAHSAAPPEAVHDFVGDLSQHPGWACNALTTEHLSGPMRGPGAHYRSTVTDPLPGLHSTVVAELRVVEERPGSLFVFESEDPRGRYRWTFVLTSRDGGTDISQTVERLHAAPVLGVLQPAMWRLFGRKQVQRGLDALAAEAASSPLPARRTIDLSPQDRERYEADLR
ncbi:MAG: SRPBCC family protein [Mycobacteriales bacterium]